MRYFPSKLDCIHWPSLSLHTVSRAVWMNSSLVLVYTAGLIVIVFLSCWPLSVNVCFIWLDAEIAFLCFETAVNLLKTKLFLWLFSVCLMGAKCAAVTERSEWRRSCGAHTRVSREYCFWWHMQMWRCCLCIHSERSRFRLSYWRLLGLLFVCLNGLLCF